VKMMMSSARTRLSAAMLTVVLALTMMAGMVRPQAAYAQHSIVDKAAKHHKMVGAATGVGTYAALKRSAARKKAAGRRLNFAERHPMASGVAAGMVTNHMLKKHYKKIHHN
jgi:di/tricarboxylate transporter